MESHQTFPPRFLSSRPTPNYRLVEGLARETSASTVICSKHFVGGNSRYPASIVNVNPGTLPLPVVLFLAGQKSDDPLSPAFCPSLFSFTTPSKKDALEKSLQRYESVKLRNERKAESRLQEEERPMAIDDDTQATDEVQIEYLPQQSEHWHSNRYDS